MINFRIPLLLSVYVLSQGVIFTCSGTLSGNGVATVAAAASEDEEQEDSRYVEDRDTLDSDYHGLPDLFQEERAGSNEKFTPQLLIIVGDISEKAARILFEDLREDSDVPVMMSLEYAPSSSSSTKYFRALHQRSLPLNFGKNRPQVIRIRGLEPETEYRVKFRSGTTTEIPAKFVTLPIPGDGVSRNSALSKPSVLSFPVVSCDRYNDDMDSSFWKFFVEKEQGRTGVFHLGDQVYNDKIVQYILSSPRRFSESQLVELFRQGYRFTWGHETAAKMLRNGGHWMIPDDHDIVNNLDKWMTGEEDPEPHLWRPFIRSMERKVAALISNNKSLPTIDALMLQHHSHGANDLATILKSGKQAAFEYQYQLIGDLYSDSTLKMDLSNSTTGTKNEDSFSVSALYRNSPQNWVVKSFPYGSFDLTLDKDTQIKWYFARTFGDTGVLFVDLRWEQTFSQSENKGFLSSQQLEFVKSCLDTWDATPSIRNIVVLSAHPLVWMDPRLTLLCEFVENDRYATHPKNARCLHELLRMLFESPKVQLSVGGDIHVFAHQILENPAYPNRTIVQLASSGMTFNSSTIYRPLISLFDVLLRDYTGANFESWTARFHDLWLNNVYVVVNTGMEDKGERTITRSFCTAGKSYSRFCRGEFPAIPVEGKPGYLEVEESSFFLEFLLNLVSKDYVKYRLNGSIQEGSCKHGLHWEAILRPLPKDAFTRLLQYSVDRHPLILSGPVVFAILFGFFMAALFLNSIFVFVIVGIRFSLSAILLRKEKIA